MKRLSEYLKESIFDIDEKPQNHLEKAIKEEIKQFLKDNYRGASKCKISKKPNEDGKYVVDCQGELVIKNIKIKSLTNDIFVFGSVNDSFYCYYCDSLTSLEGAPQEVGGDFDCAYCDSLTSLKGAPKKVSGDFSCSYCDSLTSLEGAPQEVGGVFECIDCKSLISLKGAPEWIGGDFICGKNGQKGPFDENEIHKHIPHIGGEICG